jgi:sec-independent protein translocase protein TatC
VTEELSFLDHLVELRKRLIRSLYGVFIGFGLIYHFAEELFDWLIQPLCKAIKDGACPLIYTGVAEPFMVYLKVGLLGGFFASMPWIFYQIWAFISPGLHAHERRWVIPFIIIGSAMFVGGALMGYFVIFPLAFDFFLKQALAPIQPMLSMADYFSFASGLLFAFGFLFEIPVFVLLLNLMGVISAKSLWKTWRYAVAGIFILAALVTPADPYTMLLLGIPLSIFYVGALVACSLLERLRRKTSSAVPSEAP